MSGRVLVLAAALGLNACGTDVDPAGLPSIQGYTGWDSFVYTGDVPGHGDTYRIAYVNPVGRTYPHGATYPKGTVIVKEIHDKTSDGNAGALRHVDIMRKVYNDPAVTAPTNAGWVFSEAASAGDSEHHSDTCWNTCHKVAPFDSVWHDYGK
jgi:cytochrome P460